MAEQRALTTSAGTVRVVSTDRSDGDFAVSIEGPEFDRVRASIVEPSWTWVRQVHGADVVVASSAGDGAGATADAVVTAIPGVPIAVTTADCAPVVLVGTTAVGVAHAGWRGVMAGVIEATAHELRALGAEPMAAICGPCIQPAAYEFGSSALDEIEERLGAEVRSKTASGSPALDMTAAVAAACSAAGWPAPDRPRCTSRPEYFSHRTRGDVGRQTTVAWIEVSS